MHMGTSPKSTSGCSNKGVTLINPPPSSPICLSLILIPSECLNVATSECLNARLYLELVWKAHKCYASGNLQSVPSLTKTGKQLWQATGETAQLPVEFGVDLCNIFVHS